MLDKIPETTLSKIYDDGMKPAVSESGKFLGRVPRAINAALASLDKWILQKEYNVAETQLALEQKLQNIDPDKIVPPEPYVAVPALQAISYCMSSKELHDLYANLLAKAMIKDEKQDVHPAFVEIIKQMSPIDAVVLKEIMDQDSVIAKVNFSISIKTGNVRIVGQPVRHRFFSKSIYNIPNNTLSEDQISVSIDNLYRLGLVNYEDVILANSSAYDFAEKTLYYTEVKDAFEKMKGTNDEPNNIEISKSCACLTTLGEVFGKICVLDVNSK